MMPTFKVFRPFLPKSNPVLLVDFLNFWRDLRLTIDQILGIPFSNSGNDGYLSSTDWTRFNAPASNGIYGEGSPSANIGANGNFYFRSDGGSMTTIYQKRSGAWVGIV